MSSGPDCSARPYLALAGLTLAALLFGFGGWAVFTRITGAVIAHGQLVVEEDRQIVQHPDGGVLEAILVRDGDQVSEGSLLMRLEGAALHAERALVAARHADMQARRARLEAERDGRDTIAFPPALLEQAAQSAEFRAELDGQGQLLAARRVTLDGLHAQLAKRRTQIRAQMEGLSAQIQAVERQRALVSAEYEAQAALLRAGLTQTARVQALEREVARLDGEHGALRAEKAAAAEREAETEMQALSLTAQRREEAARELRETMAQQMDLAERLRALDAQIARLELRAPVAGIVHGLQVRTPRAVLRAAEPALFVVPRDAPLMVAARIAPDRIDQVHPGQRAVISIQGLNSRAMHQLFADVVHISADIFSDSQSRETYFEVELRVQPESLAQLTEFRLAPGMPVEVFLETEARRPIDYLTRPLTDYLTRALRET